MVTVQHRPSACCLFDSGFPLHRFPAESFDTVAEDDLPNAFVVSTLCLPVPAAVLRPPTSSQPAERGWPISFSRTRGGPR